jgi:predicted nucleic acid-binding protein
MACIAMESQATLFHRDHVFETIAGITPLDSEYFNLPNS